MRVLTALMASVTVSLLVAFVTGVMPASVGRSRRRKVVESRTAVALRQSGLTIPVSRMYLLAFGCGVAAFVGVYGLSGVGVVAIGPAVVAGLGPRWWLARRAAHRQEAIQRAWPDAVRDIVASIGAGMSLQHSLEQLADHGPPALRPVFTRFSVAARAAGVVPALEGMRDDLADATSDRVIEILLVAYERGGSIVPDILRDLASATTRDIWVLEQVQTESLEQRINARAVFALPWFVLIAITLQEGPFRDFYRSASGVVVIVIGGLASTLGMMLIRRLGNQPVEPRVLGKIR